MNWSRKSAYVMNGEHGYLVTKFIVGEQSRYRVSLSGRFLGSVQDDFESAAKVCENHFAIMGSESEELEIEE